MMKNMGNDRWQQNVKKLVIDISEKMSKHTSERMSQDMPETISKDDLRYVRKNVVGYVNNVQRYVMSMRISEDVSKDVPERIYKFARENTRRKNKGMFIRYSSVRSYVRMRDNLSEAISAKMSDRV